jgi:hypothetical protein
VFTDSIVYAGLPIPPEIHQNFSTTYFWASAAPGDKFYQFYVGYDTSVVMGNTTVVHSASYQGTATAVQENIPKAERAVVFPNPSNGRATLQLDGLPGGTAALRLYDLRGAPVFEADANLPPADRFEWSLVLPGLPGGRYQAVVTCGGRQWMARLTIL